MKTKLLSFTIIVLVCILVSAEQKLFAQHQQFLFEERTAENLFHSLEMFQNDTTSFEKLAVFFFQFPENFGELKEYDRYVNEHAKELGYHKVFEIFDLYFSVDVLFKEIFIERMIMISQEYRWEPDFVNFYQHRAKRYIRNNLKEVLNILASKEDDVVLRFWEFYFDGPHPPHEVPEYLGVIENEHSEIYELIVQALVNMQTEWKHH